MLLYVIVILRAKIEIESLAKLNGSIHRRRIKFYMPNNFEEPTIALVFALFKFLLCSNEWLIGIFKY